MLAFYLDLCLLFCRVGSIYAYFILECLLRGSSRFSKRDFVWTTGTKGILFIMAMIDFSIWLPREEYTIRKRKRGKQNRRERDQKVDVPTARYLVPGKMIGVPVRVVYANKFISNSRLQP